MIKEFLLFGGVASRLSIPRLSTIGKTSEDPTKYFGAQDENRTHDLRITSALLYP